MSTTNTVKRWWDMYFPETPTNVAVLGSGLCVVPGPRVRVQVKAKEQQPDAVLIDKVTNTYTFRSNRATEVREGAVPGLTAYDIEALKDRELYGGNNRKGKASNIKNAHAKALWCDGCTVPEIASATGMGDSWVEKRVAAFGAALSLEMAENKK